MQQDNIYKIKKKEKKIPPKNEKNNCERERETKTETEREITFLNGHAMYRGRMMLRKIVESVRDIFLCNWHIL